MQNHQTQVLNYLKSGKTLSQTEAITYLNCYRLSAVIKCLRNIGYDIGTHRETNSNNKATHARYELNEVQA